MGSPNFPHFAKLLRPLVIFSELLSSTPALFIATTAAVLRLNANSLELEDYFSLQGMFIHPTEPRSRFHMRCTARCVATRGERVRAGLGESQRVLVVLMIIRRPVCSSDCPSLSSVATPSLFVSLSLHPT